MRVLVTGADGFLGAAVVAALLDRGDHVTAVDLSFSRRLSPREGLQRVEADVTDPQIADLVVPADKVLHLAAVAGVDEYIQRPEQVLDTNILGTRNVLRACADADTPVVFASTSEVYGRNCALLDEASETVLGPAHHRRWAYAVSKLAGEHYAFALADRGLCFAAIRYFNVYGPLLDAPGAGRVIGKFLGRIQDGAPLQLVDGGEAVRAFCFVDDAVRATIALLDQLGTTVVNQAVNIGNADEPVSIRRLAEWMIALSGHEAGTLSVSGEDFFGPGFEEIPRRIPDVSRMTQLGVTAEVDLATGLARTLDHWDLLNAPEARPALSGLPPIRPTFHVKPPLIRSIETTLRSGQVTNNGPSLRRFEAALADWLGVEDVVAVSSGSDALAIGVRLMGWRGQVACPSFTYIATANALAQSGLEPVFADIDPHTWTLNLDTLDENVVGAVPVNVFGVHADLDAEVPLVYDNAHGLGSDLGGLRIPTGPELQAFSLHATKVLPAVEGGVLYSPDPDVRAEARRLRAHGLADDLMSSGPGWNARMDELRAQIGLAQLAHLDDDLARRREMARLLGEGLSERGWTLQHIPDDQQPNAQNLGARCPDGVDLEDALERFHGAGIGVRRYFHPPLHHMTGWPDADLPVTEAVWSTMLCFPVYATWTPREIERILAAAP